MSPWLSDLVLRSQSDERLVNLARAGYDRAFVAIYERYERGLTRFALRLGLDSRAEDVVQQSFLSAFAALRDQTEVRHLSGWLHQIVRNRAIETVSRESLESKLEDDTLSTQSVEDLVESRLRAQSALADLARLPQRQRDALLLTSVQGHSRTEVAHSMGLSEGAVRQLVHRARQTLRSAAAALLPFGLVAWATRRGGRAAAGAGGAAGSLGGASRPLAGASASATSQFAPLTAGAASAGGGIALKATALIAATGLLATGIAVSREGQRHAPTANAGRSGARLIARATSGKGPGSAAFANGMPASRSLHHGTGSSSTSGRGLSSPTERSARGIVDRLHPQGGVATQPTRPGSRGDTHPQSGDGSSSGDNSDGSGTRMSGQGSSGGSGSQDGTSSGSANSVGSGSQDDDSGSSAGSTTGASGGSFSADGDSADSGSGDGSSAGSGDNSSSGVSSGSGDGSTSGSAVGD